MSLDCTLRAPSGHEESCQLEQLSNKNVGIIFKPREFGEYLINVKKGGKHIQLSPFFVIIYDEGEFFNSSKVKVHGISRCVHTMKQAEFFVDTKCAGFGGLKLSIEGPSKVLC